jgi:hypothetical protein
VRKLTVCSLPNCSYATRAICPSIEHCVCDQTCCANMTLCTCIWPQNLIASWVHSEFTATSATAMLAASNTNNANRAIKAVSKDCHAQKDDNPCMCPMLCYEQHNIKCTSGSTCSCTKGSRPCGTARLILLQQQCTHDPGGRHNDANRIEFYAHL